MSDLVAIQAVVHHHGEEAESEWVSVELYGDIFRLWVGGTVVTCSYAELLQSCEDSSSGSLATVVA